MIIQIDQAELNTVLAALRTYQEAGYGNPDNRPDRIHDIAVDGDAISLDDAGIDALCERINTVDDPGSEPAVLLVGDLSEGYRAIGPFPSYGHAAEEASSGELGEWVMTLEPLSSLIKEDDNG